MGADRKQPHRDGPVAIGKRSFLHSLMGEQRLQLAPERDAFEQRAGRVDARDAVGERRVHVEMRIDEGRRDEAAGRVHHAARLCLDARLDRRDAVAGDADIRGPAIGQGAALHDQVEAHLSPF